MQTKPHAGGMKACSQWLSEAIPPEDVSGGVKTDVNRQSEIPKNSWNRFCFTTGFRADQRSVVAFSTKNGRRKKVFH